MIRSLAGEHRWISLSLTIFFGCLAVAVPAARGQQAPAPAGAPAPGPNPVASPAAGTISPAAESPPPPPPLPKVPNEVKTSNEIGANRAGIDQFITQAVHQLADEKNAEAQSAARDALRKEALVSGGQATPDYLNTYAELLNQHLLELTKDPQLGPRGKLNAAIATAEVAKIAENGQLAGAAEAFINDKSEAVCLWGIKASKWIIPAQLEMVGMPQNADKLADAVVSAVQQHTHGQIAGAIADEAYAALSLDIFSPQTRQKLAQKPAMLQQMAPHLLKLLDVRLQQYRKGVPPDPRAEANGTGFLSDPLVWNGLNPALQKQAMQVMIDLINLAAQQASAAKVSAGDRGELATMISRVAAAISITAAPSGSGAVFDAIKPATAVVTATPAGQIQAAVAAVMPAVKTLPQYVDLKPPPAVIGNEPAPPPASAPTTGPISAPGATSNSPIGNPNAKIITPPTPTAPEPPPATRPAGANTPKPPEPKPPTQTPPAPRNTNGRSTPPRTPNTPNPRTPGRPPIGG
jgi:hypothetical protein